MRERSTPKLVNACEFGTGIVVLIACHLDLMFRKKKLFLADPL